MAVDAYALTSLTNLKLTLGISGTTDDTLLEDCIDRASDVIEKWLDYKVMARDYTEWLDGRCGRTFRLANQPVNTVRTVAYGIRDAFIVTCTDSTLLAATISANGTSVIVTTTDATGTDTVSTLAYSSYKSTTLMAAAVDALSGVSASVVTHGRTAHLHITPGTSFLDKSVLLSMAWDDAGKFRLDEVDGTVWVILDSPWSGWPSGGQRILVEYNAGESSIPDDIEAACIMVASEMYHAGKRDPSLQSESLGQYSYTTKIIGDNATIEGRLKSMIGARRRLR